MKILLLPQYFFPELYAGWHLERDIYESFADAGFSMVAFAPSPTRGIDQEVRNAYKNKKKREKLFNDRLDLFRFSLYQEGHRTFLRAIRYIFAIVIQFFLGFFERDVDVIYLESTPPIIGIVGGLLHKIKKIPFIYVVQDIFPDSLVHTGIARQGSIAWQIGRVIENFIYRNATKIIVISQDFKANLLAKKVPESKIEVIYNWIDTKELQPINREQNELFSKWNIDPKKFYIVYAGNFGNAQSIDTIIECAKLLATESRIQFVLIGNGSQEESLRQLVSQYKLQNLNFFPMQSSEMLSQVYSLGDLGVVCCKAGMGKSAFPSKTWSYFAAGTPVIASYDFDSELSKMIGENGLGLSVNPEDAEAMAQAIISLEGNREIVHSMARDVRIFVETHASRDKSTEKYLCVIKDVLSSSNSRL